MPRISEEIRKAALEGRLDENALRAAVYADAAPMLEDACSAAYYAFAQRKVDPKGLEAAIALCGEVSRAVWRGLGYAQYMGQVSPMDIGLAGPTAAKAREATEKALARMPGPDESVEYDGLGGARA